MWDKQYIGQDLTSFSNNGQFHGISKVTLVIDDDTSVTAGNDSGIELQAECPFATQDMADAILERVNGYQYQTYSAESVNIDPAAELGDGVTVSGIYSVLSKIDDSGNGYPSISAPGESELQDEYPVVGPGTQEINRKIESVKQWAEKNNKALKDEIDESMEESGKLITGQLGGHYIVTMNPEDGKPNGWALMDTDSMETAKNIWRATLGGIGHYSDGINSTPNVALTMDGKINASMILTGQLWANLIKTGRIESQLGNVYFDLDANGGKGELSASILRGVEDGSTTTARIGLGTYIEGTTYEGLDISTTSGGGGGMTLAIDRERGDYTLSNDATLSSGGNLVIRSQSVSSNPGGNNSINMIGNSTTGEGKIEILRGKPGGSEYVFWSRSDGTAILRNGNIFMQCTPSSTLIAFEGNTILNGNNSTTNLYSQNGKIQFVTGNYARASIESDGSARFGDLYTNGTLVTSDREKKKNIKAIRKSALDMVKQAKAYEYTLKEDEKKRIGIMYDEAPACIRSDGERKAVDLYGMITLLWKAVQELEQKIDNIKEEKNGG